MRPRTAITTSWNLMLLAAYPEWQTRARAEELEICRDGVPDVDMLRSMKTVRRYLTTKIFTFTHCSANEC